MKLRYQVFQNNINKRKQTLKYTFVILIAFRQAEKALLAPTVHQGDVLCLEILKK